MDNNNNKIYRNYKFNYYGVTVIRLATVVFLYSCNNITLKMARVPGETCC